MAVNHLVIFFVSTVLVFSESSYLEPIRKCSSKDSVCLKNYFQSALQEASVNGIPDAGIPALDHLEIKDFRAEVAGWLNLELIEGIAKGIRTCFFEKFWLNFDQRYGSVELVCDVVVEGHYRLYSNSSLIKKFLNGDLIHGDGNGQTKIEKFKIVYDFTFNVERRGNDYFLNTNFENSKYGFDILDKASFAADNLYLRNQEASAPIINIVNQNWKMILGATGPKILVEFYKNLFDYTQKYLYNVPTRNYLIDDLSPYVSSSTWKY